MLNKRVEEAVAEKNVVHLVDAFTNIILKDKRFDTREFDDSLEYAQKQMGEDIFKPFDGEPEKSEPEWTVGYWNDQLSALQDNFCLERIDRMRRLGRKLYQAELKQRITQPHGGCVKKKRTKRQSGLLSAVKKTIKNAKQFLRH